MAYLGTKPANQVIDSTLIADGTVTTSDLANGAVTNAKAASGLAVANLGFTPFNAASAGQLATRNALVQVQSPISVTGNWGANTWHEVPNLSFSVFGSGVFILSAWVDTHNAGGNSYNMRYSTMVPVGEAFSNSEAINELVLQRNGHSPNTSQFFMRTRLTPGASGGNIRLDFQTNQAWSGLNNGGGRNVFFEVWRIT
jgi:hypothetical protein